MKIVKFCKQEHNIKQGCSTIQFGTFDYYREMDSKFSIADAEEGFIKYECDSSPDLFIDSRQFNAITGGAITITDADSPPTSNPKGFDRVNFKGQGGSFVGQDDGTTLIQPGKMEVEVYYPNSYIFCCSLVDDNVTPDPKSVSSEYDSFYEIKQRNLGKFADTTCDLIRENLAIRDLKLESDKLLDSSVRTLGAQYKVTCLHRPVEYVDNKTIILTKPSDFEENHWLNIFIQTMFQKDKAYEGDKEYRFVFVIEQQVHTFLPVKKDPKIITLNPVAPLLS